MSEAPDLGPFPDITFAHAISLGANCEAAHQLRRNGRHTARGPFDWLVTPLDALGPILAEDGRRLGSAFVSAHAGTSVRCGAYDVLYHHEFPRAEGNLVRFDAEAVERCRAKMAHKWMRLVEACSGAGPILFLRFWAETDLPWDRLGPGKAPLRSVDLDGLVAALAGRFPQLDFRLLLLLPEPGQVPDLAEPLDPRVAIRSLPRSVHDVWAVTDADWAGLLAALRFRDPPTATGLGETLHWSGEGEAPGAQYDILHDVPVAAARRATASGPFGWLLRGMRDRLGRRSAGPPAIEPMHAPAQAAGTEPDGADPPAAPKPGPAGPPGGGTGDPPAGDEPDDGVVADQGLADPLPDPSPTERFQAGIALAEIGLHADALAALLAAGEADPQRPRLAGRIAAEHEALGQETEALVWLRRAVAADPREPGVYGRLVSLGLRVGDPGEAMTDLADAIRHGSEPPTLAVEIGRELWAAHRSFHAAEAFTIAFEAGVRECSFLRDHLGLLAGEARYADVLETAARIEPVTEAQQNWLAGATAHARLALAHDRADAIAAAETRERGPGWLSPEALLARIREHRDAGRPFSFVRVGDGEARFAILMRPDLRPQISDAEAGAIGGLVWENWFGEAIGETTADARAELMADYERAVATADVIGTSSATRLRQDTGHYGYLAVQEAWLRAVRPGPDHLWTDAFAHHALHGLSPFLADVLAGARFVGVVSPHPGLASTLGRRFGIADAVDHVVPAEGRLPNAGDTRALGRHFPDLYRRLLRDLRVPHPGAVFLVAAGLLGKVYCARIRERGGIALDIGALADAWMGFDTRDGLLAAVGRLEPPVAAGTSPPSRAGTTLACLSMPKTGSTAIAAALGRAGFADVEHLHLFGPRSLAMSKEAREAHRIARRLEDPAHAFQIVTCLRDPIARILSNAFHNAAAHHARTGIDLVRDAQSVIDWIDRRPFGEGSTPWFDDTFRATFGFDFRLHPFDRARRSLRFTSDRLKLLVLRQEDPAAGKETELGWLMDRDRIALDTVNDSASRPFGASYDAFVADFEAPPHWLASFYETDLMRHFYTEAERAAFRARWRARATAPPTTAASRLGFDDLPGAGGPDRPPVAGESDAPSTGTAPSPNRTIACLSIGKTSSMALTAALRDAGFEDAHHLHYLGPRALAIKRLDPEPMLDLATDIAGRIGDPEHTFTVVTCVRDPIARALSQAFYNAHRTRADGGMEAVRDPEAVVAWWDKRFGRELSTLWFDDTFKATFGVDFREHPFDHDRRSLRFTSERLRLLVLRQEDPSHLKERELGWLMGRAPIALPLVNDAAALDYAPAYAEFLSTFVAPRSWLDAFYETDAARHFYTDAERAAFRTRWSRPSRIASRTTADPMPDPASPTPPVAATPAARMDDAGPVALKAEIAHLGAELERFRSRQREGHAVDFNDFAYRPRTRDWSRCRGAGRLSARFAAEEATYADLFRRICGHDARLRTIPIAAGGMGPNWENWWLPGLDAAILYGLVAALAPRVFLEIGSGHSTRFVRRSIDDNALATRIVSIDPNPTAEVDALCDEVIRAHCEDVPAAVFRELRGGDMLFVDNSHRCFQNSDVTVFFTEILPELAPGVVYGLHDIFLPYDYPESWTNRFYNEQYLLMSYLLGGGDGDAIVLPAHHVSRDPAFTALKDGLFEGTRHLDWLTSSFWMRRADH